MCASKLRRAFFSRNALGSRVLEMSAGTIGKICAGQSVVRSSSSRFFSTAQLHSLMVRNPGMLISQGMTAAGLLTLVGASELAQKVQEVPCNLATQACSNLQYFLTHASSCIRCLTEKNIMGNQLVRSYN